MVVLKDFASAKSDNLKFYDALSARPCRACPPCAHWIGREVGESGGASGLNNYENAL